MLTSGDAKAPSLVRRAFDAGNDDLWGMGALLAAYLPEPEALIRPLLETLTTVQDLDFFREIAVAIPGSYRVSELKIAIADEALRRYHVLPSRDLAAEADAMDAKSSGLHYAGRHDEARESLQSLVELYARLAQQDPEGRRLDYARAMVNYGAQLVDDQTCEALDLANKAISIVPDIPELDRSEMLSQGFDLRSLAFKHLRRPGKAVKAAERAAQEGRTAARTSETARARQPLLIMNLANRYSESGRHQEALETIHEAIRQHRLLEADHPDPLSPNMADLLFNYAQCLQCCGMTAQAREAIKDAVTRLRRLAERHPKFRDTLSVAVGAWATCLHKSPFDKQQDRDEYEYVIGLLSDLSAYPRLRMIHAATMLGYGTKLLEAGDREEGEHWVNKGMRLSRQMGVAQTRWPG